MQSMNYSTFNKQQIDQLNEPMLLGQSVNVSRYDQQKYEVFEKLIEKQISYFWRPEEVDISKDKTDYASLPEHEKHIFISNLKYQVLLASIQGRSPNIALLPLVSIPELETWVETWSFNATVHARSYSHIISSILDEPSNVLDSIMENESILKRIKDITYYYDSLIEYTQYYNLLGVGTHVINDREIEITEKELKHKLYMCLMSIYTLEAIRFYVTFACSFSFAERELLEGNAKIIKLIARDEVLHLNSIQHILTILGSGKEGKEWEEVAKECRLESVELFYKTAEQEKEWTEYLFEKGSMVGLSASILNQYIEYITNIRAMVLGLPTMFDIKDNPIPWISSWLDFDSVQNATQETEINSYLTGQIDATILASDLEEMEI